MFCGHIVSTLASDPLSYQSTTLRSSGVSSGSSQNLHLLLISGPSTARCLINLHWPVRNPVSWRWIFLLCPMQALELLRRSKIPRWSVSASSLSCAPAWAGTLCADTMLFFRSLFNLTRLSHENDGLGAQSQNCCQIGLQSNHYGSSYEC